MDEEEHEREQEDQGQDDGGGNDDVDDDVWICNSCTFHNHGSEEVCAMCYTTKTGFSRLLANYGGAFSICQVSGLLQSMLSTAVTGTLALVGAVSGAIMGALVGRATHGGFLLGAGLGAVAGAVLSMEVLEASRAYWHSQRSTLISTPSFIHFLHGILSGSIIQDFLASATQQLQFTFAEVTYDNLYEMFIPSDGRINGASDELLETLPRHVVARGNMVDAISCAICLQELEEGEIGRTLPACNHTFHFSCVNRWLIKHVVCPVCRRRID